jgi:hypothetical protein
MQYTKRTLVVSQSRVSEAAGRIANPREGAAPRQDAGDPAVDAVASLLLMEQSLLSMKRFLATVQHDLEVSLGADKPLRRKAARYRAQAGADELAQRVVNALRDRDIDARHVQRPAASPPEPRPPVHRNDDGPDLRKQ